MAKSAVPVNPKEYLIRAKIYRVAAMVFAAIGLIVTVVTYASYVEGRVLEALRNPFVIGMFILPFLPAIVLSLVARKNEKKYQRSAAKK
jgi:hypothetical protein